MRKEQNSWNIFLFWIFFKNKLVGQLWREKVLEENEHNSQHLIYSKYPFKMNGIFLKQVGCELQP